MQSSVPGLIEMVKIADISQGRNPIRVLSMRTLSQQEMDDSGVDAFSPSDLNRKEREGEKVHRKAKAQGEDVILGEVEKDVGEWVVSITFMILPAAIMLSIS